MKKITFTNILLVVLTLTVLWLIGEQEAPQSRNTAYIQNTDSAYMLIHTVYGVFPIKIDESKTVSDRTDLSFTLLNPYNIRFGDADLSVHVGEKVETLTMNVLPGTNKAKFKVSPIERGETIRITLMLDKISF